MLVEVGRDRFNSAVKALVVVADQVVGRVNMLQQHRDCHHDKQDQE